MLQSRIGASLIYDHGQQKSENRRGECGTKPCKPSRANGFWAGGRADKHRLGLLRQDNLALLHKLVSRAHIQGALRTVKVMLFELVRTSGSSSWSMYFSVIFSRTTAVWSMVLYPLGQSGCLPAEHRSQAGAKSGGFSPECFRYDDLNACLARCNSTRKYSRSTPKSRQT